MLEPIAGTTPVRVNVLSLVSVKRALDLIRRQRTTDSCSSQVMASFAIERRWPAPRRVSLISRLAVLSRSVTTSNARSMSLGAKR